MCDQVYNGETLAIRIGADTPHVLDIDTRDAHAHRRVNVGEFVEQNRDSFVNDAIRTNSTSVWGKVNPQETVRVALKVSIGQLVADGQIQAIGAHVLGGIEGHAHRSPESPRLGEVATQGEEWTWGGNGARAVDIDIQRQSGPEGSVSAGGIDADCGLGGGQAD